jgi:uncharacterized protein (TIGR03790 family)
MQGIRRSMLAMIATTGFCRAILPSEVVVLYNDADPASKQLAETYRTLRGIPQGNEVGLPMPKSSDISREEFAGQIVEPLRQEFNRKRWWKRSKDANGVLQPVENRMRVIVSMRGVPLRIRAAPKTQDGKAAANGANQPAIPADPVADHDEASVDSELALFGVDGLPTHGALQNRYFKSSASFSDASHPYMMLTARIDAASAETCERMMRDAVETEATGLWGMAYVDIANKFPQGDGWLETIAQKNRKTGVPTVVDRFAETLPKHYPMGGAAQYFGWYDWHVGGPFLHPDFRFKPGAVAVHIHSFSAEQLVNASKNWCAPLLDRGATVTVGNVYEPYLHLTHDLGILHERLLVGHSWVEACWMAMPVCSWQGVVLGDPLYRPFRHLDGSGKVREDDKPFRALRAATLRWADRADERRRALEAAAQRTSSGCLAEAIGLDLVADRHMAEAVVHFQSAKAWFGNSVDRLRQDFHIIGIDRAAGRKSLALDGLRAAKHRIGPQAEAEALQAWIDLLDPPPPPKPEARPPSR